MSKGQQKRREKKKAKKAKDKKPMETFIEICISA